MHLWIDGQCLQTGSRLRGIGRYLRELIRAVGEFHPGVRMSISFNAALPDAAIAARGSVAPWIAPGDVHVWQGLWHKGECGEGYSANYRLNEIALAHHVACLAPDIALSASPFEGQYDPVTPLFRGAGHAIPRAAIFYDAIPHRYPERYLKKKIEARCFARRLAAHRDFDLLLAISDFARREADDLVPGVPAVAIDAGTSPDFLALTRQATDPGILARLGLRKPFLLYVGGIDWRKNLDGVSQAFALLPPALRQTLQFVIAGDPSPRWFAKFRAAWQAAGLDTANLTALGHVSDENLVQLYKQTDLAIQPSRMEGFGLTALEAMVCGAPVIAANAGALPEVVGDPRALFDPLNPKAMSERIAQFLSDRALTQSLVTQGLERGIAFQLGTHRAPGGGSLEVHRKSPARAKCRHAAAYNLRPSGQSRSRYGGGHSGGGRTARIRPGPPADRCHLHHVRESGHRHPAGGRQHRARHVSEAGQSTFLV